VPLVYLSIASFAAVLMTGILLATNVDTVWGDWGLRDTNWTVWVVVVRNLAVITLFALFVRELRRRRSLNSAS
jgi:uncharacterized membrane protein